MKEPSSTDWAYLAGLIDGEGYIGLIKVKGNKPLKPRIVIAMSTPEPIKWVHSTFNGGKYRNKIVKANGRLERRWTWGVYARVWVWYTLDGVLPYLKLKRQKAEEVITHATLQLQGENL